MGAAVSAGFAGSNAQKAFKKVTGDDKKEVAPVKDTGSLEGEYSREGRGQRRHSKRSKSRRGLKSDTTSTNKVQL